MEVLEEEDFDLDEIDSTHSWAQDANGICLLGDLAPGPDLDTAECSARWVKNPFDQMKISLCLALPEPNRWELMLLSKVREGSRGVAANSWQYLIGLQPVRYTIPHELGCDITCLRDAAEVQYLELMSSYLQGKGEPDLAKFLNSGSVGCH